MEVVQVDVVGSEATQTSLHCCLNPTSGGAAAGRVSGEVVAKLRGDDHIGSPGAKGQPEILLGEALVVDIRCVEEGHAVVEACVDNFARLISVDASTEVVATETYNGHFEIAEHSGFHLQTIHIAL